MNDADASAQTPARRPRVLDRKIRLKVALIAVALLLIAGLAMWVSKTLECARANERADRAIAARTQLAAENLAEAIAIFANRDVIAGCSNTSTTSSQAARRRGLSTSRWWIPAAGPLCTRTGSISERGFPGSKRATTWRRVQYR